MIIIERVLLPCVASIRRFSSFASSLSLFIGAEFGDTIETIRCATTVLPNPMLSKLGSIFTPFFVTQVQGSRVQGSKVVVFQHKSESQQEFVTSSTIRGFIKYLLSYV
jgi:hypothetical protein